jgi:hypothetical protein
MKPDRIRVGDHVHVKAALVVLRVGYPKAVADYLPEVRERFSAHIEGIFKASLPPGVIAHGLEPIQEKTRRKIEHELAHMLAHANHFGGRTRSLHVEERPALVGLEFEVAGLRSVVTGTYSPGRHTGGYDWEEYEPADLDDRKTHRLAVLERRFLDLDLHAPEPIEIATYNLERAP